MKTSNANAIWNGTLKDGKGTMSFTNYSGTYTFASRFEEGKETNPEELIGAAQAGCYSMFLSALISGEGFNPEEIDTVAAVSLGNDDIGPRIENIKLTTRVVCEGLSEEKFNELAVIAKEKCPVSRLYSNGTAIIELDAELLS